MRCLPQYGEGTLRLTTRQCYQLHGVLKHDLKTVFSSVIKAMGSTLGACGDVNRNVLSPPVRGLGMPMECPRTLSVMTSCSADSLLLASCVVSNMSIERYELRRCQHVLLRLSVTAEPAETCVRRCAGPR